MSEPQFSMQTVLRPYSGFNTVYQGQPVTSYIALTPDGVARDDMAGRTGYDADLVRGLPVPQGARIIVHLPYLLATVPGEIPVTTPYIYRFIWRSRSLADFGAGRQAANHNPTELSGLPDTTVRYPIAATANGIVYNQGESGTTIVQNLHCEEIAVYGDPAVSVLTPDGTVGAIQQGMEAPSARLHVLPRWVGYSTVALSDELIVAVHRATAGGSSTWNFTANTGADETFLNLFTSYSGWGVMVEVGRAAT